MSREAGRISENSRRIARNTFLLYFRMLLLMFIGLFTSRVVLKSLGVDDYGVYNAVGGVVSMFTFVTASLSSAISRFLAVEIEKADKDRLKRVFSTGVLIQLGLSLLLVLLVETVGLLILERWMVIPEGRMAAARTVLHCSLGILVVTMLSVPYNALIIAHEKMSAFALISVAEGALKLGVALLLSVSSFDKLVTYAFLMLAVAVAVRLSYGIYCRRKFEETGGRLVPDPSLVREMAGFAGWNVFGSGAYVLNTQGANVLVNVFFGVAANAARGVAFQVENIVKQFASNFLTALNPQITKSWASGDKDYCFELVRKGAKFSYLVILLFLIPFMLEAETLLSIWLGQVPERSAEFVRLALAALAVDMTGNTLLTLQLATGQVKRYYLITGLSSLLCLPAIWLAFRLGAGPQWAYIVLLTVFVAVFVMKLRIVSSGTGFPVREFVRKVLLKLAAVTVASSVLPFLLHALLPGGLLRLVLVCLATGASLLLSCFLFALTAGERAYLLRKPQRWMPDRLFLEAHYYRSFGRVLDLKSPRRYTEKIQWQKLYDRNPLYHKLADKAEVKAYVSSAVGGEYVIPTLGVWDSADGIDWDSLPESFVLKCTHDSGSVEICRDRASFDRASAAARLARGLRTDFSGRMREWAYRGLRPRIIAEEYLGDGIADYKFFCFNGEPRLMFVATERSDGSVETKFDFFDMDFRHLDIRNGHPNACVTPARPKNFEKMKALAAVLSAGIPQVRVDFYEVGDRVYFGEYTFYHWGGFMPFEPEGADEMLGDMFILPGRK